MSPQIPCLRAFHWDLTIPEEIGRLPRPGVAACFKHRSSQCTTETGPHPTCKNSGSVMKIGLTILPCTAPTKTAAGAEVGKIL